MGGRAPGKYRHALQPLIATTINQQLSDDEDHPQQPVDDADLVVTFEDDEGDDKEAAGAGAAGAHSSSGEDEDEEPLEATCQVVGGGEGGEGAGPALPFVAYFAQAGFMTEGVELVDDVEFRIQHQQLPVSRRTLYKIHGSGVRLGFVARGTAPGEYSARGPRYAVARVDRHSGTAQLTPICADRIFRLEPHVRGMDYGPQRLSDSEDEDEAVKRQRMAEGFVSTRRTRESQARTEARITSKSVASAGKKLTGALTRAKDAAELAGITRERVMGAAAAYRRVPPHNPHATTWQEAYLLEDLLPHAAERGILPPKAYIDWATNPLFENHELHAVPHCVRMRCRPCLMGQPRPEQLRRAKCLGWHAALLAVHTGPARVRTLGLKRTLDVDAAKRGIRRAALEACLQLFFVSLPRETDWEEEEERWGLDRTGRTLALSYALVMALLAEGGRMPADAFQELRAHLQVAPNDLAAHFRELGATTTPTTLPGGAKSFDVVLLPPPASPADEPKTLQQCFPALKVAPPARR